ncbi:MAG TPA: hypothetical protein VGN09_06785 [Vicinamibacteria bacterium]
MLAVVVGILLVVLALAGASLRRGDRYETRSRRFICPRLDRPVDCVIVDDIGNGLWKTVRSCSAFGDGGPPRCEQECVALENRGFHLRSSATRSTATRA